MKLTKYAQSCFLIETEGKRILVDPGYLQYENSFPNTEWKDIDIILVTHKHSDHCQEDAIKILINNGTVLYASQEVAAAYPDLAVEIVKEGDVVTVDNIKIEAVKAVHGYIPAFKNSDKAINENIGFIIHDSQRSVYTTSDTILFENDYKCDIIFVPVCNHGVVMGPFEAALFAKETGASTVIPYHYDNPKYPVNLESVKEEFEKQELNYKILGIKESIEI